MADGRVCIITGAGSGIGRAAALSLGGEGFDLVLVGRTESKLLETAKLLQQAGLPAQCVMALAEDLSDPGAAGRIFDQTMARWGKIDGLANVAGYAAMATIAQGDDASWNRAISDNLMSAVRTIRACWSGLTRRGGVIVNVSSMASIDPFPGFAAYACAKAAVNMLTLVAGREGASAGIKTLCIAPGAVETPMLRGLFDESAIPRAATMDPARLGKMIGDAITGKLAFESGDTLEVPE